MLTIIKSLNNNIILAETEHGQELVAFGTGIGFKKQKGDTVSINQVMKVFHAGINSQVTQLLEGISPELLGVTEKVVSWGEAQLNTKLNPSILFALGDHLRFALERQAQGMEIEFSVQWEVPHLYGVEYQIGREALKTVRETLGIELPQSEAAFIALHFVNAQLGNDSMGETLLITELIKKIVKVIQKHFDLTIDKSTVSYSRFITHLRYFIVRQKDGQLNSSQVETNLVSFIKGQYGKSYESSLQIRQMLRSDYGWTIKEDELVYLTIHIQRIIDENQVKN